MDAKVVYWTGAFINFGLITALAIRGVRQVRRGDLVRHRRSMLMCVALVGAFLVSYGVKLAVLGRENLAAWSGLDRGILRFHEACVLVMLIAGAVAITRVRRLWGTRSLSPGLVESAPLAPTLRRHRRAGWTGVGAAALGLVTAAMVLFGMYARL